MNGKSKGSGLLNDKGEVVREIKAENGDVIVKYISHGWLNGPPNHHVLTPPVDDFTNYQNDGMGCPGEYIPPPFREVKPEEIVLVRVGPHKRTKPKLRRVK